MLMAKRSFDRSHPWASKSSDQPKGAKTKVGRAPNAASVQGFPRLVIGGIVGQTRGLSAKPAPRPLAEDETGGQALHPRGAGRPARAPRSRVPGKGFGGWLAIGVALGRRFGRGVTLSQFNPLHHQAPTALVHFTAHPKCVFGGVIRTARAGSFKKAPENDSCPPKAVLTNARN